MGYYNSKDGLCIIGYVKPPIQFQLVEYETIETVLESHEAVYRVCMMPVLHKLHMHYSHAFIMKMCQKRVRILICFDETSAIVRSLARSLVRAVN